MTTSYQRIVYPERAEYLLEEVGTFRGYKIFLDHWGEITNYLQEAYEVLRVRRFSKALIIYGNQGCGKSVLANKIHGDFIQTRDSVRTIPIEFSSDNIWHRIVAGPSKEHQSENITAATTATVVLQVKNNKSWIEEATQIVAGNPDRTCMVIADNCERDYFLQGLLNVSDDTYLATGRTDAALKAASHKFVELCRTKLRGCFFIFFTNDQEFALAFDKHVNEQHKGLVDIRDLAMPSELQKEAIVRINVNRLNPFSYWLCLNQAGPEEKKAAWSTLKSAETFPTSFLAVDKAIRSSTKVREGKPARKCVLNAFVLCNSTNTKEILDEAEATDDTEDIYSGTSFSIRQYKSGWSALFNRSREQRMLESEWNFKIILAGEPAVAALLAADVLAKQLIDEATTYHAPGTHLTTKAAYSALLAKIDQDLLTQYGTASNGPFWARGGLRNYDYESKLKDLYPSYNTRGTGFLNARPDIVIADYVPCSILRSPDDSQEKLNAALRRDANVVEFTSIKDFTLDKLVNYIRTQKLPNYIAAVQEQ